MRNKNLSFHGVILLLVFLMSGLHGLAASVMAASGGNTAPIIRHTPPDLLFQGKTVLIKAIVEDEDNIRSVILWRRTPGQEGFQKITMNATSRNTYEGALRISNKNQPGIEYYIEAVDEFGNQGRDGSSAKPYFLEVQSAPPPFWFSKSAVEEGEKEKKPFWKKPWFWVGVAAVIGGGIAAAGSGGDNGGDRGTVVVD